MLLEAIFRPWGRLLIHSIAQKEVFSETGMRRQRQTSFGSIIPPVFYRKGWDVLRMWIAPEVSNDARRDRVSGCAGE
jgi:hypothetical protein